MIEAISVLFKMIVGQGANNGKSVMHQNVLEVRSFGRLGMSTLCQFSQFDIIARKQKKMIFSAPRPYESISSDQPKRLL